MDENIGLEEQKNKDTITIGQIKEISSQDREVFIKPAGRRVYYIGSMRNIPKVASKILCILRMSDNIEFALLGQG